MIKKSNLTADNGAFLNGGDDSNSTAFNEQLKLQQAYSERRASRIAEQKQLKQDRNKALQAFKEDREEALLKQQRQKAAGITTSVTLIVTPTLEAVEAVHLAPRDFCHVACR